MEKKPRSQQKPRHDRSGASGNRALSDGTAPSMVWRPKSGSGGGNVGVGGAVETLTARPQNRGNDPHGTSGGPVFPYGRASSAVWKPRTGGGTCGGSGGCGGEMVEAPPRIPAASTARMRDPYVSRTGTIKHRISPNGMASSRKWKAAYGVVISGGDGEGKELSRKGKGKSRRRKGSSSGKRKFGGGEKRNWAEIPGDALSVIFEKLGPIYVLYSAQAVCRLWRQAARDSRIWKCIDFRKGVWEMYNGDSSWLIKMGHVAVDRSMGQAEEFSMEYFPDDEMLMYMAERSAKLRCLRLVSCYDISNEGLTGAANKLPLLEELNITYCPFSDEVIKTVGKSCPHMKSFHLNQKGYKFVGGEDIEHSDDEALAIANSMPLLRELQLFGNQITNKGLWAILDDCPLLESLDLRQCFNINLDEALKEKCNKIKNLRLTYDSTADYPYDAEYGVSGMNGFDSSDYDYHNDYGDYCINDYDSFDYDDFCTIDYDALFADDEFSLFFAAAHLLNRDDDLSD